VTTALRLQPTYTIVDAIRKDGDDEFEPDDLGQHIEDYLVRYDDNFWTLAAPREPSQADHITPVDATRVLEALRTRFDYIVVDTPTALAETVLAAFDLSEHLFVMATLDLPSVRNLGLFLQTLQKLQIPTDNVSLVLNKVEKDIGIDVGQIVKLFPQGFRSTLPYAKEVSRSINLGKPVIAGYPESDVSRRLVAGLVEFLPEGDRARVDLAASTQVAGGTLSRFFRRSSVAPGGAR
jgi:pilus assembly protein CpaE